MTRLFGTNGIRWKVGEETDQCFSTRLGLAIGTHFGTGSTVCIGKDTRTSGPQIFNALNSGLMACGVDVIDLGVVPTPVAQYSVPKLGAEGGIVVTASHNPPEYNGVKCLAKDGTELSRDEERSIEQAYADESFTRVDWQGIGSITSESTIQNTYREEMVERFMLPKGTGMQVIVDCSNGTAGVYSPGILRNIGCRVSTLNAQPDGAFPGRYPEPIEENLGSLMMAVECGDADFGVAHDGDADRAIFVDEKGKYVSGDGSFALFARAAVKAKGGKVVTPVNSSMLVEHVVRENGGEVVYSPIGSPLIARQIKEIGAIIGGEGNGGVIFPDVQCFRDGILTAVRMVHLLVEAGRPLSEVVSELPEYHLARTKLPLPDRMTGEAVLEKVKVSAEGEVIDIDGIKVVQDDHWVLVRLSGTEPVLRITAESGSPERTQQLLGDNKKKVEEIIRSL